MPLAALAFVLFGAQSPKPQALMPRYQIGHFHYQASTKNKRAQAFFDQGLAMIYGYQYGGALHSFEEVTRLDPKCAMGFWGIAEADGPTINSPAVDDIASKQALSALDSADKAPDATPLERELIAAERKRFAIPAPSDRAGLNKAYADAMRQVWHDHRGDANVGALFADSLIDEHPWDQWTPDGSPKAGTEELMSTLDEVLKLDPLHPHGLHLYIHAYEASPFPGRAKFAADKLENLQPGLGHMQHMPCHIYVHTGNWKEAVKANLNCISASEAYFQSIGIKPRGPYLDHYEMALSYAAAMRGQSALAQTAIDRIFKGQSLDQLIRDYPDLDGETAMPLEIMKRFGKWDDILAAPEYGGNSPTSNAMRHADRAVAFAAKGEQDQAEKERSEFKAIFDNIPADKRFDPYDTMHDYLAVDDHLIAGELLVREPGHTEEGLAELRKAVEAQDALHYSEPPDWLIPARHSLGAALVNAKQYAEAESVYREDLRRNPENGWSLFGLGQALKAQGKEKEANQVYARFKKAWADADYQLTSSCACLAPK